MLLCISLCIPNKSCRLSPIWGHMASPHDPSLNADQSQARSHFEKKKSLIHQHLLLSSFSSYFLSYHQKVHRASSLLHQMLPSPPRLHVCAREQGYCLLPGFVFAFVSLYLSLFLCMCVFVFLPENRNTVFC